MNCSSLRNPALCAALLFSTVLSLGAQTRHTLASGETLYSLARRYEVSVADLVQANSIEDPSALSIGMQLLIPGDEALPQENPSTHPQRVSQETPRYYLVGKGDTYYGIARKHNITVSQLLEWNSRLETQVLQVGERLVIAWSAPSQPITPNPIEDPNPAVVVTPRTSTAPPSPDPVPQSLPTGIRVTGTPQWPVAGYKHPFDGKVPGVAIEAESSSYVHAIRSGNVVWTGLYRGFGNVVLIDSGNYIYLYGGNEDLFVNVGESVLPGHRIGRLGESDSSGTGPRMYFSVFREGVPISPEDAPRG